MNENYLLKFMNQYAYTTGVAVHEELLANNAEIMTAVDAKIAVLTGADKNILDFLEQIKELTDAEPGTEGWQKGQNIFNLINDKYSAISGTVADVAGKVAKLVTDLTALAARVTVLEGRVSKVENDASYAVSAVDSHTVAMNSLVNGIGQAVADFRAGLKGLSSPNGTVAYSQPSIVANPVI